MKKFVLKLDLEDESDKRRALKTVATLSGSAGSHHPAGQPKCPVLDKSNSLVVLGIDEINIDAKAKKLTVIGTVDPVSVVSKLRKKNWATDILSVGPAKEPEKKEEAKKDEAKGDPKKDEAKKEEEGKKQEEKKVEGELVLGTAMPMAYRQYYPPMNAYYYVHPSMEENPNSCVIC